MKKQKIVSSLFLAAVLLPTYSFAATPQQNNEQVQKALTTMGQELAHNPTLGSKTQLTSTNSTKNSSQSNNIHYTSQKATEIESFVFANNKCIIKGNGFLTYNIFTTHKYDLKVVVLDIPDIMSSSPNIPSFIPAVESSNVVDSIQIARHDNSNIGLRIVFNVKKGTHYQINRNGSTITVAFSRETTVSKQPTPQLSTQRPVYQSQQTPQAANLSTVNSSSSEAASEPISNKTPEKTYSYAVKNTAHTLKISLKDISCIVSPYNIKQVLYSQEDGIQVQVLNNRNVFVKLIPKENLSIGTETSPTYSTKERDIYIVTDQKIYSLNLVPTNMPAVTYFLSPKQVAIPQNSVSSQTQKALSSFFNYPIAENSVAKVSASSYVNYLLSLIKTVYNHKLPDGFVVYPFHKEFDYLQLTLKGKYRIADSRYSIYAFTVKAKQNVNISNSQFTYLFTNPLAIDIIKPRLNTGETTMLYIVTGGINNE